MSVVAWDGEKLAADKRAVGNGGAIRTVTKIERLNGGDLVGIAGDWDIGMMLVEWYRAGAEPQDFPKRAEDGEAIMVVVSAVDGKVMNFCSGPYSMPIEDTFYAIGSGRDHAEAVMYLGYDAVKAVEVASALTNGCGEGVSVLYLRAEDDPQNKPREAMELPQATSKELRRMLRDPFMKTVASVAHNGLTGDQHVRFTDGTETVVKQHETDRVIRPSMIFDVGSRKIVANCPIPDTNLPYEG